MKLKDAFKRLQFTIVNQNKPNQTDCTAINTIAQFVHEKQTEVLADNILFAKLYTYLLSDLLNYYTDIDFANKEINKILAEPLQINRLHLKLKEMDYRNYFLQKGILDPFLKTKTADELEEIHERYKHTLPELNDKDFSLTGNNWTKELISYYLESNINLSIKTYNSYV